MLNVHVCATMEFIMATECSPFMKIVQSPNLPLMKEIDSQHGIAI